MSDCLFVPKSRRPTMDKQEKKTEKPELAGDSTPWQAKSSAA